MIRPPTSRRSEQTGPHMSTTQLVRIKNNAEKRKKKLQSDEMVKIISPYLVKCLNCQHDIKLSEKSDYDNFHWDNHRKRCLKSEGAKSSTKPPKKKRKVEATRIAQPPKASSPQISDPASSPSSLPQLTESDEEVPSVSSAEAIDPPGVPEQTPPNPYSFVPAISPFIPIDNPYEWSWSRLKPPRFRSSAVRDGHEDEDVWSTYSDSMDYSAGPSRQSGARHIYYHQSTHVLSIRITMQSLCKSSTY
ncbi:hypothetical protein BJ165DRAFT_389532 [Panaeolus papilionaceus]|nr:hypothetical protein BJ165DRAFT_389532 [Panaeolus papilionaceus]